MNLMNSPRSIEISLTNKCNLRCLYCYHFASDNEKGEDLPVEEWVKFFKELKENSVMDITLAGGEPFLYKDIKRVIEGIVENKMRFSFLTNGTLIDEEMAEYIASTKRCNFIQVSIDGHCNEIHNLSRGAFDDAVRGIKILQKHGINVTVRVTINRYNVRYLNEIAEFLLEELKIPVISTNSAGYIGLCTHNSSEIQMNIEERGEAMQSMVNLSKKYKGRIVSTAGPLTEAKMWTEMVKSAEEGEKEYTYGGRLTACGCVWSKLAVRADGTIVPCNQISSVELGKINRDKLDDVWKNSSDLNKMRERKSIELAAFESCRECGFRKYCTGNCPSVAYTMSGDIYAPNMESCLKNYLENGGKLPDF